MTFKNLMYIIINEQVLQTVKGLKSVAENAAETMRFFVFIIVERAVIYLNKPTGLLTGFQPLHT